MKRTLTLTLNEQAGGRALSGKAAVVVGIDKYNSPRWPNLNCCNHDADQVAAALGCPEYGFDVTLITDDQATTTSILGALVEARRTQPDLLVFYFAGHGASTELGASLVTFDNEEFAEGIDLPKLAAIMATSESRNSVTFLDCCHAGAAKYRGVQPVAALRADDVQRAYSGLESSRAILAACGESEFAMEEYDTGHGMFTYYLLEGLLGEAADYQGNVSVHSLYDYVSRPFAERNIDQTPIFRGDISGRLILATGLSPRLGPPLEENISAALENEAESFLEQYGRKIGEYQYSEWRTEGYEAACRALTPIDSWFRTQLTRNPSLSRRPRFAQLYESFLSRKIQLGAIDPGTLIDEGILSESIGSGGFGTVWRILGADNSPDKAYKIYHPHDIRDLEKSSRFKTGYEAMRMLRHDHIVRVYRFSECPLGFVMDYIPGQNLREVNPASAMREPHLQLDVLILIAETIQHAHNSGVIHRDIKPENIVCTYEVSRGWVPYLTDFDLAWFSTQTRRATKSALGVVYYAAPEQHVAFDARKALGKRPTLDVFSFGQLAHFMVTGQDPDPVRIERNIERIGSRLNNWATGSAVTQFLDFYRRATAWEPEDRFQEFDPILSVLRDVKNELTYTTTNRKLEHLEFRNEVIFQASGRPVAEEEATNAVVSFTATSGNWNVILSCKEQALGRKQRSALILMAHFIPSERIGLQSISAERMRSILNARVDSVLQGAVTARRRSGRHGSYEVFVDFEVLDVSVKRVRDVRNMLSAVIGALERE
jgi:eukaryotic-like serine/threonine-protein kinase